ncbi:MAG: PilZ domain-containing protein [Candidatus Thiodiazotropha sp. (ex Dulcina madagascariensis)]|nr:PilZ domain-containing protein [Candidatus Thiodiazotropha sp. (ex Epidulcina cf. delphinae)]MCU7921400.1 PilZ domain-containing protein [Candidatus Thiodiazotropha sp. (ex Dulcina madagascariensis)]MCU7925609.1 PilZ domain-containing protein [Candidatus Thiodiazotropha sp. (ex Dulcina madagascariensis)]MCU7936161.1 PilZ domain-containing protein [Candidatus Thiodiazotropha sp. (ex Dulcina madagascariensis)]
MYIKRPSQHNRENSLKPEDRRTIKRRHLIYYLRVWELDQNNLLGHVVDITTEGMMLISDKPIPTGEELSLEIRLPDTEGALTPLNFRAICRWSDKDINTAFYDSGFEFTDKSPAKIENLQQMIEAYGFND